MACTATFLSGGCTPRRTDTINTALKRIAGSTAGGGAGFANMSGVGSPLNVVVPNAINITYRDTSTDNYWWSTTALSSGWTPYV